MAAGLLLRRSCGVTGDEQLIFGENGKPYLKNGGLFFSISHSGDYAVLTVSGREVGADIEKIAPVSVSGAVAARCFTPDELSWMRGQAADEAFYRLWTAKESVMKASGLGFSLSPKTFSVLPTDASAHRIAGRSWFLHWLAYDGHVICSAVEGAAEKPEVITVTPSDLLHA